MATQIIGSLAINNLLPIQARGAGQVAFGPISLPAGYSFLTVQFDLQQVQTLTAQFTTNIQLAQDGVNFVDAGGAGLDLAQSGYRLVSNQILRAVDDTLGTGPVRVFGQTFKLPGTELATRQVKGTVTCSEAATSGVTLMAW